MPTDWTTTGAMLPSAMRHSLIQTMIDESPHKDQLMGLYRQGVVQVGHLYAFSYAESGGCDIWKVGRSCAVGGRIAGHASSYPRIDGLVLSEPFLELPLGVKGMIGGSYFPTLATMESRLKAACAEAWDKVAASTEEFYIPRTAEKPWDSWRSVPSD